MSSSSSLPVADRTAVRRAAVEMIRADRRAFAGVLLLTCCAAGAGSVGPWLLGRIIDDVRAGASVGHIDRAALLILCFAVAQLLCARWARLVGHRFGERTAARIRDRFVDRALSLPASVVDRVGPGDLTNRGTNDIGAVASALRDAGPDVFVSLAQALFLVGAVWVVSPLLGAVALLGLVGIPVAVRWYLRRARTAYLAQGEADSHLAEQFAATATGARTVEAFSLQARRTEASEEAVRHSYAARMRTLSLRSVLFPSVDFSYAVPVAAVLLVGGALHTHGVLTLGAIVTCALYLRQLSGPLDTVLFWVEQLQSSGASFARVEGIAGAARTAPRDGLAPVGDAIELRGVHYAYEGGADVVRGVDLTVRPGERLALVGPSGAGKTTLSKLLAGIDVPRAGSVTVGGAPVTALAPEELRRHIVLVTQEHHVFLGSVRDNLRIAAPDADDDRLRDALAAVGAQWADTLPDGLDTELGAGGLRPDGPQAQQLALARVVLADPHTVVLDEATALLDPATARHTERALAAVLRGRTVIAVAHRLHTAHDADRVAVMEDGRLTELGPHDELVAADGAYAALWRSWHGAP
ncbi:ABC transporter ATP-binding protein [Streptomyces sp. VRA16 Mangrove soil]|uniref:ABC transporter ATP-binding protein n=1 Tax=Streptomyces sp. VRA16 Mangrove soil TaxID=2817434 RepID=UPI001A9FB80B|nr:ABC transporter ATP-binding protein [Streptomyces sp. VRA16 Mangrove soil]MBO1330570.1 ABC transporter ATP-binding protein [Streptomyces sp. VRA16 Mangrove soil]